MQTVRTENAGYILPSNSEMKEMAQNIGLKAYTTSIVEDICNLSSDGVFVDADRMKNKIIDNFDLNKIEKNKYNQYVYLNQVRTGNFDEVLKSVVDEKIEYNSKVQDFLRELDFSSLIGDTPLEKAMNLLKLLSTQKGGEPKKDGDMLPIFTEQQPEKLAHKINELMETIESLDEIENELLESENNSTLEIACDMLQGKEIMLKIKRDLDKLVKLKTSKSIKLIPDIEGNEIKYRGMKELSEMDKLNSTEFVYPKNYRNLRMVTGEAMVRERCVREEKKMLLYIICDNSGSMTSDNRFWKAGGVVMNRLKAVLNNEAEVYFSFFNNDLMKEHQATNENEAKKLMEKIKENNFNGGGTSIAKCVIKAVERIEKKLEENPRLTKPELFLVTDGDDNTTSLKPENLNGIKLHTFVVGNTNQHIIDLAIKSGGVGFEVK